MPEPDEIPLTSFAENVGNSVVLKCRTVREAILLCEELEKADIIPIVSNEEQLEEEYKQKGYIELRVSARAYESQAELRSIVEFQYKQLRSDRPLAPITKILGVLCGATFPFGLLVFLPPFWNYKNNGYLKMARQFKYSLFVGIVVGLMMLISCVALEHRVSH